MQTSMLFTIGTALERARQEGQPVDVLVEGHWLTGRIVGSDSQGVVLVDGEDHVVLRLDRIAVVRVHGSGTEAAPEEDVDARPMPGPRQTALVVDVA